MPFVSRSLLVAVHAAALSALLVAPLVSSSAMASPMPMPMPLRTADYRAANHTGTGVYYRKPIRTKETTRKGTRVKHFTAVQDHDDTPPGYISRRSGAVAVARALSRTPRNNRRAHADHNDDSYDKLNGYYQAASTHSKNLRRSLVVDFSILCFPLILSSDSLAVQSSSVDNDDSSDFHQQAATELTGFHTNMLGIETVLKELGADKGLANYDRTNDLETLLKNIVNVNKDTLSFLTTITYNLPIVGPTLGPSECSDSSIRHYFDVCSSVVYEIKCVLDDILNACENLTDAILNILQPLLLPLIGKYLTTACNNGVGLPTCLLG